ncbi:hypothetical protein KIH27_08085 [Mycobacterium sp. M1]|uniref:Uncharacterized protein n=1 Tax=Mycolicibacter acidiphilus TaxID=2835306 RepID=A0ABS5RGZ0_9MYCO|nr:hypothetical protein [Mycolicibacter acidiphilus]MBS9533546.1 hypothetical protein [Mycolicibacter acidiphilus]
MSHRISLKLRVDRRTVTVCQFRRPPRRDENGEISYGDWQIAHELVRVRTAKSEADGMRESFSDPMDGAQAKKAAMVVLKTDTRFEFWDVPDRTILFTVGYDKLARILDAFETAGEDSIEVATLRAALERIRS